MKPTGHVLNDSSKRGQVALFGKVPSDIEETPNLLLIRFPRVRHRILILGSRLSSVKCLRYRVLGYGHNFP